jgi:hypothetical protein
MESGAKGCEVVVSGKLRAARAKSMKFTVRLQSAVRRECCGGGYRAPVLGEQMNNFLLLEPLHEISLL